MQNQLCKLLAMAALSTGLSVMAAAQTITTSIPFSFATQGVAVNPVTNKVYVVAPNRRTQPTDSIGVIDGSTDTLSQTLSVPQGARSVTVDYIANRVYVGGCDNTQFPVPCTVTVIDGKTNATLNTILVTTTSGFGINGVAANPVNGLVYVANASDNVVDIIDGYRAKVVGSIALKGISPAAIAINPILNRLYVPSGSDLVDVIDAGSKKIIATTVLGEATVGAAANILTGNVFVTDQEASGPSTVGVLNFKGALRADPTVDDAPLGVDVDPIRNLAFVASTAQDDVTVIDGSNNTVKSTVFNVPASFIAVNFVTGKVYISGRTGVTVMTEK
jgi:DNA-binding beta-propeller fold protein YncE